MNGADAFLLFCERCLTHVKGPLAGKPLLLDEWQKADIVRPLLGGRRADGTRRYRTCYVEIPRKNGKSTFAAAVALYLLFADGEKGAEVVSAAADRDQAAIVFDLASAMVRASAVLSQRCRVLKREIVTASGGRYKAISAEAYSKHGMNPSGIIFDEVHTQPNRELWDTLQTGTGARLQPLTLALTTAGHDRESLCWELHSYAAGVIDGSIDDPSFLPVIYAAADGDDWTRPEVWRKANPGYGASVTADYLSRAAAEAKLSPGVEQAFRRLHLNQWTESVTRWISLDRWDSCRGELPDLAGRECVAALDLSSTLDLTALVLAHRLDDGRVGLEPYCWAPSAALKTRERRNKQRFDVWASKGQLTVTDGEAIDYERIRAKLLELSRVRRITEVAIDRWNAAQLAQQLQADGLKVVGFGQGYASMSPAAKDFEALVLSGRLVHDGHPVLRWCVGNCTVEMDAAGNIKPSKRASGDKIDLCIAAIMAAARLALSPIASTSGGVEFW